jgi:hypothetical protein
MARGTMPDLTPSFLWRLPDGQGDVTIGSTILMSSLTGRLELVVTVDTPAGKRGGRIEVSEAMVAPGGMRVLADHLERELPRIVRELRAPVAVQAPDWPEDGGWPRQDTFLVLH